MKMKVKNALLLLIPHVHRIQNILLNLRLKDKMNQNWIKQIEWRMNKFKK